MKTMGKRILSIILCLCLMMPLMVVAVSADGAASGSCGENLTWELKDGTLTISGKGKMGDYIFDAPWEEYKKQIKAIVIEDGVTYIGWSAFEDCSVATSVKIPDSVNYIETGAFEDCSSLTEVIIPDTVWAVQDDVFAGCESLTNIKLPNNDSFTSIGDMFSQCISLTEITIPANVVAIYTNFSGCINLAEIKVDENNTKYVSVDGVLFNKDKTELVKYPAGKKDTAYVIPESVTSITSGAFKDCMLTEITIPANVTSVIEIGNCLSLTEIKVDENNTEYVSVDGVLFNKDKTELVLYPCGRESATYTIPDNVNSIGYKAFAECRGLSNITILDGLKSIGYGAFEGCSGLTEIKLPLTLVSIDSSAFYGCKSLTEITIPASVTTMGSYSLAWCDNLKKVTFDGNTIELEDGIFEYSKKIEEICVPKGCAETYSSLLYEGIYNDDYCRFVTEDGAKKTEKAEDGTDNQETVEQVEDVETDTQSSTEQTENGAPIVPIIIVVLVVAVIVGVAVILLKKKK